MFQRISLESYPSHFQQACRSLMNEQHAKAEHQYKKCLQLNPSSYSSYLNLAYIYHMKRKYDTSVCLCNVAINMKPYCSQAYYNRCLALVAQGPQFYSQASIDLSAAFSCYYLDLFKNDGNLSHLEKSVEYCTNNIESLRLLALLSTRKAEEYNKLLMEYQDSYRIEGEFRQTRASASVEQGLFRLTCTPKLQSLQQIQQEISDYVSLRKSGTPTFEIETKSRKVSMQMASCLYNLTIKCQSQLESQREIGQLYNSFTYEKIQLQRQTTANDRPLQELSIRLNVPEFDTRYSLAYVSRLQSPSRCSSICDAMGSSRFSHHQGCLKCKRQSLSNPTISADGIKMLIKTIQIFRNQNIYQPRPYLIIYGGSRQVVTEVDYEGGHFPKWSQTFYLEKETSHPYRIELWHKGHKEKEDQLIGTASFVSKQGRFKCYFIKRQGGTKKTGYMFIQLGK